MLIHFNLNLVEFLILSLAAWRASHFIVEERGPFGFMLWVREHVFRHEYNARTGDYDVPNWSEVFSCVWCLGLYVAATFIGIRFLILSIADFVILSLAVNALIILIEEKILWTRT